MSTVDLSALPSPEVLESLDFEDAYQEELAVFRAYMGDNWNAELESDPVVKLLELAAYRRLQIRARINDASKSLLLAYAQRTDLDISHGINANVIRKWLPIYRDKAVAPLPAFVPLQTMPKRHADEAVVIALPLGAQTITVKWPVSDPDGCARFIRSLSQ